MSSFWIIGGEHNKLSGVRLFDSLVSGSWNFNGAARKTYSNSIISGNYLSFTEFDTTNSVDSIALFGKFNNTSYTSSDRLIVGAGTYSDRRNCFTTGHDGTDSYITVGSTKVTESQLIQLLALLNPSTT